MALTITEKNHWNNRTRKIIAAKIAELEEAAEQVKADFDNEAKDAVAQEINLEEDLVEYESLGDRIATLQAEQKARLDSMAAKAYGDDLPYHVSISDIHRQIESLVDDRSEKYFSEHPFGQHLEYLEAEKERLLDKMLLTVNVQQVSDILDEAAALHALPRTYRTDEETLDLHTEAPQLLLSEYSLQ